MSESEPMMDTAIRQTLQNLAADWRARSVTLEAEAAMMPDAWYESATANTSKAEGLRCAADELMDILGKR